MIIRSALDCYVDIKAVCLETGKKGREGTPKRILARPLMSEELSISETISHSEYRSLCGVNVSKSEGSRSSTHLS